MGRDQRIATLARNYPTVEDPAALHDSLTRLAWKALRNAEGLCNDTIPVDQREVLRSRIRKLAAKHGIDLNFSVGGDPRGFVLKLVLPDGTSNSFDGIHFGFPLED